MQRAVIANPKSSDTYADDRRLGCDTNDYAEMVLMRKSPVRPFPCLEERSPRIQPACAPVFLCMASQVERVKSILYLSFREQSITEIC